MQLFPCPFCGMRAETEFAFVAEAGRTRPEGLVADPAWASYLYENSNPKGATHEIWKHLTCGEFFKMKRDSVTHIVEGSASPGNARP